jgi:Flp pilus assembly protein TadD
LGNGFVWDDHQIVQGPAEVGLSDVSDALTTADVLLKSQPTPYYRPLTRVTFVADRALFGLSPLPYHLENVGLHVAAALALFALARRLFGQTVPAFGAALLFAVHPVNAETVNFVSARNNALVALFTLAACTAYLRARETGSRRSLGAAAVLFLLALLSKETGLMLLPFLGLHELVPSGKGDESFRAKVSRLAPLAFVAFAYVAMRLAVLSSVLGASVGLANAGNAIVSGLHIIPKYLWLVILPAGLTVHHEQPEIFLARPAALVAAWGAIVTLAAVLVRQRRPATWFGLLWFAVNLGPVSGIVPIPSAPLAERYLYVPAIGLWLVAADQITFLAAKLRRPRAVWAALVIPMALATVTMARNRDWRDDLALFSSAVRVAPSSTDASYNHAIALADRGDEQGARLEWERTVALDPAHVGALARLGTHYAEQGDFATAASYFSRVLATRPDDVETRFNLALLLERLGRPEDALVHYREFIRLDPVDYPDLTQRVRERIRTLDRRAPAATVR